MFGVSMLFITITILTELTPNTTVVDVSRCDNKLFLRPHLELNSDQPSQFH